MRGVVRLGEVFGPVCCRFVVVAAGDYIVAVVATLFTTASRLPSEAESQRSKQQQ